MTNYFQPVATFLGLFLSLTFSTNVSAQKTGERVADVSCPVPPGYTSCVSSCLFSECCVVWNPTLETGGCSCFFGVARCKTSPIRADKSLSITSVSSRKINFHLKNFENFLSYCKANNIIVQALENSYRGNILSKASTPAASDSQIDPDAFDLFAQQYEIFINGINPSQLNLVKSYLGNK